MAIQLNNIIYRYCLGVRIGGISSWLILFLIYNISLMYERIYVMKKVWENCK